MEENNIIVISCYSNKKKKDPNNLHNSVPCPSIFNKNNSIFIINDKMEKIEFGKNKSFSQLIKNNKTIILKIIEKDNLKFSGVSGQSFFDKFNNENLEDNELLVEINSLIEKGVFEKRSLDQESQSNSKSNNLFYIVKDNDVINNQLSCNKREDKIKELEKKIETLIKENENILNINKTLIKEKENILNINKKLTEEVEYLKKEKDKLYNIIESMNRNYDIIKKYEEENKQLKEGKLLEKKELNDNDNFKKNNNLTNKNENEEQNDLEIQKKINEMREEYGLDDSYSDKKLYEVLIENDLDVQLSFSKLFL